MPISSIDKILFTLSLLKTKGCGLFLGLQDKIQPFTRNHNFLSLFLCILFLILFSAPLSAKEIICASTKNTSFSGLFDSILPIFEKKTGIKVKVVAMTIEEALEIGKKGNADVLLVYSNEDELKAIKEGYFINRFDVMYNDFVIIGPAEDTADIRNAKTPTEAFKRIAEKGHFFVSTGDLSGTNSIERQLWARAGIEPKGYKWYIEVKQGIEIAQLIANEKKAYLFIDKSTWLATKDKDKIQLKVLFDGHPSLRRQHAIMLVNPEKHKNIKFKEATEFIKWIISDDGQKTIASFRDKTGNQFFYPNAYNRCKSKS